MKLLKKKSTKLVLIACAAMLVIALACAAYLGDYYRADMEQIASFVAESGVTPRQDENGYLLFEPENPSAGLIFYPGGKVEYTAYIPLMSQLADRGIMCVLVEMPFHLAVLDMDAAAGIPDRHPEIEKWYIGGHSLGGSMAASYLSDCEDDFEGLILLGSYSTADLSQSALSVLSVYGSEDLIMNREKYTQNRENLPKDFTEIILDGGCHAYFGMYGPQDGDGTPSLGNEAQILYTADAVLDLIR